MPVIGSLAEVYRYLTMPACQTCHFQTSQSGVQMQPHLGCVKHTHTHSGLLSHSIRCNAAALNKAFLCSVSTPTSFTISVDGSRVFPVSVQSSKGLGGVIQPPKLSETSSEPWLWPSGVFFNEDGFPGPKRLSHLLFASTWTCLKEDRGTEKLG